MNRKWRCLLIPLGPIAIVVGFIVGILRSRDRRIAFYCDGDPVTLGEARRWGAVTKGGETWEPKTKH